MRRTLLALTASIPLTVALALPASAAGGEYVQITQATGEKVAGQYIVTLKDDAGVSTTAAGIDATPLHTYRSALNGFAAKLSATQLQDLQRNPQVAAIEEDGVVHADTTQTDETWGLDRIDQRTLPGSNSYNYNHQGTGVKAYVIDTGIQADAPTFGTRAQNVFDAFGGNGRDCDGHGTHVAGTIGGERWGVAKLAQLRGVRVLDCAGSGTWSGVIAGVDWVTNNHVKPAVANMSLGGGVSAAVDNAVAAMTYAGVFTAVSAGNSSADACAQSPARVPNVTTVAASDRTDTRASFSNQGLCVDVYAPGVDVRSSYLNGTTAYLSGTSMASPHVAGAAAVYRQVNPDSTSGSVNQWIINASTKDVIIGNPADTPNRLLFKGPTL